MSALSPKQALTPDMQDALTELLRALKVAGYRTRITSTLRTRAEQTGLYRKLYPKGLAVAKPGCSKHELGRAVDLVIEPESGYAPAGAYWESLGGRWGGSFGRYDPVHFEDPYPGPC